jgi:hypothetical protein
MSSLLQASAIYPAGVRGVSARVVALSTGVKVRVAESGPVDGAAGDVARVGRVAVHVSPGLAMPSYGCGPSPSICAATGCPIARADQARTLDAYSADVDAVLDALELPAASLLGQSMVADSHLRYALRRPERVTNLILINPTGLVPVPWVGLVGLMPRGDGDNWRATRASVARRVHSAKRGLCRTRRW